MKFLNKEKNGVPLYFQLEQIIKSQIMRGEIFPGEQIPTEKQLCKNYQVSNITTRQAISNLVNEGLLIRKQGKGTFVSERLRNVQNLATSKISGDINEIIPDVLRTQNVKVLDIVKTRPPQKVARLLNIEGGKEAILVKRLRSENNITVSYIKNYLPIEIGEQIKKDDLRQYTMLRTLRDILGIPLKSGMQYIEAIVADFDIASSLSIAVSSPVLYLETIISDSRKKAIEFSQTFYRADLFRFALKMNLKRTKK